MSARGGTLNQLAEALRKRAREMGGEAIVGLAQADHTSPGQAQVTTAVPDSSGTVVSVASFSVDQVTVLSGTVIRFAGADCPH